MDTQVDNRLDADGSKSDMLCSHCFQGGRFSMPDVTAKQMQDLVRGRLKSMGFPGFVAGLFTRGQINSLAVSLVPQA